MKGLYVVHMDENGQAKVDRVTDAAIPDYAARVVKSNTDNMIQVVIDLEGDDGPEFYTEEGESIAVNETSGS